MFDNKKTKDRQEIVAKREQEKKLKFLGTIKPHKGHTLFKVNKVDLTIEEAEFEDSSTVTWREAIGARVKKEKGVVNRDVDEANIPLKKKKVIVDPNYFYISALNIKSVEKKLIKAGLK